MLAIPKIEPGSGIRFPTQSDATARMWLAALRPAVNRYLLSRMTARALQYGLLEPLVLFVTVFVEESDRLWNCSLRRSTYQSEFLKTWYHSVSSRAPPITQSITAGERITMERTNDVTFADTIAEYGKRKLSQLVGQSALDLADVGTAGSRTPRFDLKTLAVWDF